MADRIISMRKQLYAALQEGKPGRAGTGAGAGLGRAGMMGCLPLAPPVNAALHAPAVPAKERSVLSVGCCRRLPQGHC